MRREREDADVENGKIGGGVRSVWGERRREGSLAVITLSIRPQDGLHQPPGLMFDRIIRKLSQSVITGAHLASEDFHSLSLSQAHTHMHKYTTGESEPSVVNRCMGH